MIQSAVTVSLVPEAKGGPFVFWEDLSEACAKAAALGFDAIEIFPRSGEALQVLPVEALLANQKLKLAAVGTGAGWVLRRLSLTDPSSEVRGEARRFVGAVVDAAGRHGAPAIIGSMQGRWTGDVPREQALAWLCEAIEELGSRAERLGVPLLIEPLNRYETNLLNRVEDSLAVLDSLGTGNVKLLCDLFHMNIEEETIAESLGLAGKRLGHVHFVDSNRRPAGLGHLDYLPIAKALDDLGYAGFVSAEALPFPTPAEAATVTMATFRRLFRSD